MRKLSKILGMDEFVYCQPSGCSASCGACCGMYNWTGHSRALVQEVLEFQTDCFMNSDRSEKTLLRLKDEIFSKRPRPRYPVIYNCEFVGFIDREKKRVGCLLHPGLNNERSLRHVSHHGRQTCDEARCTVYSYLSAAEVALVAKAADDWYLYGLCVTDLDLVKEFFEIASELVFEEVKAERVLGSEKLLNLFRRYLSFKETWPYGGNPNRFGKYYFAGKEYPIYKMDYNSLGCPESRFDKVLVSLGSEFGSKRELGEAEEALGSLFREFSEAWRNEE